MRDNTLAASSSSTDNAMQNDNSNHDDVAKLQGKVQELLDYCAENELDVPTKLKNELTRNEESGGGDPLAPARGTELLSSKKNANKVQFMEDLKGNVRTMGGDLPFLDIRIKDGSFKVMVPDVENDPLYNKTKNSSSDNNDSDSSSESSDDDDDADVEGNSTSNSSSGGSGAKQHIKTIRNTNPIYSFGAAIVRFIRSGGNARIPKKEKVIMEGVNLKFEPSKMYLVLGAPGAGKSTLLKMIAQKLPNNNQSTVSGEVTINGVSNEKEVHWSNLVGFVDQIDRLHSLLTVEETLQFAFDCRCAGTHRRPWYTAGSEAEALIEKLDDEHYLVNKVMEGFGLQRVKDTFVGDQQTVRGVSGGEKKRVTVAEMICAGYPVMCFDEMSTGLDAATTYEVTKLMAQACRIRNTSLIVSLLQPPPETVANFDEIILVSEGKIIYSGPVEEVLEYFQSLGYELPERMDVCDWLQTLPTPDGAAYLKTTEPETDNKHLTTDQFVHKFYESEQGKAILSHLYSEPTTSGSEFVLTTAAEKYANTSPKSLKLVLSRELLLWWRDRNQIKQKVAQNIVQGIVVGSIFWQANTQSIIGVLFQSMLINILGAMLLIVKQFPHRAVFYKQQDANFFPTWTYIAGKTVANIPNSLLDSILYGTFIYWMAGLAYGDGAGISHYFMFLCLLFVTSICMGIIFGFFATVVEVVTVAQAAMAVTICMMMIFSGFAIQADVIPNYWIWFYWMNPVAWVYRGLAVNEFDSGAYDYAADDGSGDTEGEQILTQYGFTWNDEPFTFVWAGYAVIFLLGVAAIAIGFSTNRLNHVRFATGKSLVTETDGEDEVKTVELVGGVSPIPFKRVDLTFKDIHYTVKSSLSDEKLELLKGIDGVVESGRMTALMGASGAGKTTLMDVLALRKTTGEVEGQVWLNGHLQEEESFRRCTGYVEQFDEQSEALTIRETVEFSACLRLDESDSAVTAESRKQFVEMTLDMLELSRIQNLQVGSDETGGLSFEQRKRLSIAVELVSNPSVLFLDEPTSGLDARAALIVMRGLKRIALSGRAVCATIHQPSISIFSDFDDLLLLRRGGEAVYYGSLGTGSTDLITYLERYNATPKIQPGENPATWMLTTIGAGSTQVGQSEKAFDYAASYHHSKLRKECLAKIETINAKATDENKIEFPSMYATTSYTQGMTVLKRAMTIYVRSPNYNVVRNLVALTIALVFGSAFAQDRNPSDESQINSVFNSIFISVIFLCVCSQNTVLSVFEKERNMYYRHKASNMYGPLALLRSYTLAEYPFIIFTTLMFVVPFYFLMGFAVDLEKFLLFFVFVFLGFCTFTFTGQMFMSLLRTAETAQSVGSLFIVFSILFSGLLIRPSEIENFWIWAYWVFPGHYLFEALLTSQFFNDQSEIEATDGSAFYDYLGCSSNQNSTCSGTVAQWMEANYSDYSRDHVYYDGIYFAVLIVLTRVVTLWALTSLNYRST